MNDKVIEFISLLNQIFYDKNKNGSVKGANNNQVCMSGILNLLFCQRIFEFLMIRKNDICNIPLSSHFVPDTLLMGY